MTKVVVTGAAGFIASHTIRSLVREGSGDIEIVGIDGFTAYYDTTVKRLVAEELRQLPGVVIHEGLLNKERCSELFAGADVVIHCAAQPGVRDSWADFGTYVRHNVDATHHVMDSVVACGVPRVVYSSSSSVYGQPSTYPTTEDDKTEPRSPYGVTKLAGEKLVDTYGLEHGISTVSLRYFTVYGPGQRPDMAFHRLITSSLDGSTFTLYGDGTQIRDFTYVEDVARANVLSALVPDLAPATVLNVCGGSPVTLSTAIKVVEAATGNAIEFDRRRRPLGDVPATGGTAERARRLLGWEPTVGIEEGIERHVSYLTAATAAVA